MPEITYHILHQEDHNFFQLVGDWYFSQWKIPSEKTIEKLAQITEDKSQLQVLMLVDNFPIATGGIYNHVGLHNKEPRFKKYKNWLAQVYTIPAERQKGYGALLCKFIADYSRKMGIQRLYLFTDTAERLYERLGWTPLEKVVVGERKITVMELELNEKV